MAKKDENLIIYEKLTRLIKNNLYTCLEQVMYALKTTDKLKRKEYLLSADIKLYVLKTLIRLSFEFQYITPNNFMTWDNKVGEIGRMIGGWIKTCQNA
jgi:hypothetical protein